MLASQEGLCSMELVIVYRDGTGFPEVRSSSRDKGKAPKIMKTYK
jgi:hypothetical protein